MNKSNEHKILADNRKAFHDYEILEKYTAGMKFFYCVRHENLYSEDNSIVENCINVTDHLNILYDHDLTTAHLLETSLAIESETGKGSAKVLKNGIKTLPENTPTASNYDDTFYTIYDDYSCEMLKNNGKQNMDLKGNGSFICSWEDADSGFFCEGKKASSNLEFNSISLNYEIKMNAEKGSAFYGVLGNYYGSSDEFRIVDGWSGWFMADTDKPIAACRINGIDYDIYKTTSTAYDKERTVYWSIRHENAFEGNDKSSLGSIDVLRHLEAFEKSGLKIDNPYNVKFSLDVADGTGSAEVNVSSIAIKPKLSENSIIIKDSSKTDNKDIYYRLSKENENESVISEIYNNNSFILDYYNKQSAEFAFGKEFDEKKKVADYSDVLVKYSIEHQTDISKMWFGVTGKCGSNGIDFKIVDYSSFDIITKNMKKIGSFKDSGESFDIYCETKSDGTQTLWSISTNAGNKNTYPIYIKTINVSKHLEAYKELGYNTDTLSFAEFIVDAESGYGSIKAENIKISDSCSRNEIITSFTGNKNYVSEDNYNYEIWSDDEKTYFELAQNGAFNFNSSKSKHSFFQKFKKMDRDLAYTDYSDILVDYKLKLDNATVNDTNWGVYGMFDDMSTEFYIVDNYNYCYFNDPNKIGTFEIDGESYTLYESRRYGTLNNPSINGYSTIDQYYCFRDKGKNYNSQPDFEYKNTINVTKHLKAWEKAGVTIGKLWSVGFYTESANYSGDISVLESSVNYNKIDNDIAGDFNNDGIINSFDVVLAKKLILSNETAPIKNDLNQSGKFDIGDVVLLQKFVLGKVDKF